MKLYLLIYPYLRLKPHGPYRENDSRQNMGGRHHPEAGGQRHVAGTAQAIAKAFRETTSRPELATKTDLRELELRLDARVSEITFDRVKWIAGMLLAQAGLAAALVTLL